MRLRENAAILLSIVDEAFLESPIGTCRITANDTGVSGIQFLDEAPSIEIQDSGKTTPHLQQALEELRKYFAGTLTTFSCALAPEGTDFQKRVWTRLSHIPFGTTKSYGQIAQEIGQPTASRAVGGANNRNPIPIIVPCHRVIGASNALVGFGGGLWRKQWMLEHEGIALPLG